MCENLEQTYKCSHLQSTIPCNLVHIMTYKINRTSNCLHYPVIFFNDEMNEGGKNEKYVTLI